MSSERLRELLIKAVRELEPAEQDEVLGELLTGASARLLPAMPHLTSVLGRHRTPGEPTELVEWGAGFLSGASASGDMKLLPIRLPSADYERLRTWSREHNFSMAVIIRTLVERFLN